MRSPSLTSRADMVITRLWTLTLHYKVLCEKTARPGPAVLLWAIELLQQRLQPALARQHFPLHLAPDLPGAGHDRQGAHHNHADDQKQVVSEGLLVDPQAEEDEGHWA